MSIILNIDTSGSIAVVSLAKNGILIDLLSNENQKDHAAFLHPAIDSLLKKNALTTSDIKAVAVVEGPGSYTGLRVGMASAKGFCFALNIPLLTIGSLELLTAEALKNIPPHKQGLPIILCPMIDARRMEVFTGLYSVSGECILEPMAIVLDEYAFIQQMDNSIVYYFGSGAAKWKNTCIHSNARFIEISNPAVSLAELSIELFNKNEFFKPEF